MTSEAREPTLDAARLAEVTSQLRSLNAEVDAGLAEAELIQLSEERSADLDDVS